MAASAHGFCFRGNFSKFESFVPGKKGNWPGTTSKTFSPHRKRMNILYSSRAFPLLPDYFGRGGERRVRVAGSEKGTFPSSSLALPISPSSSSSSSLDRRAQRGSSMGGGKRGALPTCLAPLLAHILSFSRTVQVHTSPSLPPFLPPPHTYVRPSSFVCTSPPPYTRPYTQRMKVWK